MMRSVRNEAIHRTKIHKKLNSRAMLERFDELLASLPQDVAVHARETYADARRTIGIVPAIEFAARELASLGHSNDLVSLMNAENENKSIRHSTKESKHMKNISARGSRALLSENNVRPQRSAISYVSSVIRYLEKQTDNTAPHLIKDLMYVINVLDASVSIHAQNESKLSLRALLLEDDDDTQSSIEYQDGDSLDAQVDRYFADYEAQARTAKHEGRDFRMTMRRLLTEEGDDDTAETEEKPAAQKPSKPSLGTMDVEEFANSVARLIENYDTLLEVRSTMIRRSVNFIGKNYDQNVVSAFEDTLREKHGLVDGESKKDVEDELFQPPPADRAGPGGAGG